MQFKMTKHPCWRANKRGSGKFLTPCHLRPSCAAQKRAWDKQIIPSSSPYCCNVRNAKKKKTLKVVVSLQSRSSSEMSGRLAISASARGMAEDSSSSRQMKKTTKTYVMKTDSQGNVTTHTDVQVSGSGSSESG